MSTAPTASKVDLKRELAMLYRPRAGGPRFVDVPELGFLMIDGDGDPEEAPGFTRAIEALYSAAYTLKFGLKKLGLDFTVMPLEGLWWADEGGGFSFAERNDWRWTAMIAMPDEVTPVEVEEARAVAATKRDLPSLPLLRLERFHEGLSVQITHVGPFSEEASSIERVHAFIHEQTCAPRGKHHEIYLSDPKRTPPERLKTIIRQPVQAA
jgi:hypothetical protein